MIIGTVHLHAWTKVLFDKRKINIDNNGNRKNDNTVIVKLTSTNYFVDFSSRKNSPCLLLSRNIM